MNRSLAKIGLVVVAFVALNAGSASQAQVRIKDLCTVKGQERLTLRGVGLVVGLAGTGDPKLSVTKRALARSLSGSGLSLPTNAAGQEQIDEFDGTANAALVFVTAEVAGFGARQGTLINCRVDSFGNATSLKGGQLQEAALTAGPFNAESGQLLVYATATGKIDTPDETHTVAGIVTNGCQLQVDIQNRFTYLDAPRRMNRGRSEFNPFGETEVSTAPQQVAPPSQQLYFDLIIKKKFASFGTASEIADTLRNYQEFGTSDLIPSALDQVTVQVPILAQYESDPVDFIHQILELEVLTKPRSTAVVINTRDGLILIGEEVRFDPSAISTSDFAVEIGSVQSLDLDGANPVSTGANYELRKLQQALNALQVPAETLIGVIEALDRGGYLYGEIIYID